MITITNWLERDRAKDRLSRFGELHAHAEILLEAVNHPAGDPLLCDVGRYVGAALDLFADDLVAAQETLSQAIEAWEQSLPWRRAEQ